MDHSPAALDFPVRENEHLSMTLLPDKMDSPSLSASVNIAFIRNQNGTISAFNKKIAADRLRTDVSGALWTASAGVTFTRLCFFVASRKTGQ